MTEGDFGQPEDVIHKLFGVDAELKLDVIRMAQFLAAFETARYYTERMNRVANFASDFALFEHAFSLKPAKGLVLEFGVASGRTINKLASLTREQVYGFDVFTGLPETWRTGFPAGMFEQHRLPQTPPHVQLVQGLFEDTLPKFLAEHDEAAAFVHVDCDLYTSAKTIFDCLGDRINAGTIIVFDEYFNYPGWKEHEYRAFKEYTNASGHAYEYIGMVSSHQQVAVRMLT
jgi:hypothetical protein